MSFILEENKNQNPDDPKKEWDDSMGTNISDEDDSDAEYPYEDINDKNQKRKSNVRSFVYDLLFYAILIFVCIYILPNFVIQRTIVDGSSMANTLLNGEQLYVEKISYHFDMLDRFDIIVFYPYGRKNEEYYVKRIIGLPGETIQIIGSDIYINNEKLEENYGKDPIEDPGRAAQPITLGEDEFFVMGDNRNVSKDSRDEEVGNVTKENIGGKAIFRISPFSRFGTID
jgi:signal peptidase I